jgi:hypothetical protein
MQNAIGWDVLPKLTADDLREIGITAVGDRRRLLEAIATLGDAGARAAPEAAASEGFGDYRPWRAGRHRLERAFQGLN